MASTGAATLRIHQVEVAAHLHTKQHTNGNYPRNRYVQVRYRVRVCLNSPIAANCKPLKLSLLQKKKPSPGRPIALSGRMLEGTMPTPEDECLPEV